MSLTADTTFGPNDFWPTSGLGQKVVRPSAGQKWYGPKVVRAKVVRAKSGMGQKSTGQKSTGPKVDGPKVVIVVAHILQALSDRDPEATIMSINGIGAFDLIS